MKKFHNLATLLVVTLACVAPIQALGLSPFEAAKIKVFASPYDSLPHYKVSTKNFGKSGDHPENYLLNAARRTLVSRADFIDRPEGQKLLNANGICFSGEWQITQNSQYTGLFEQDSTVPIIARASVALTGTTQSDKRAFGLAIKLFPESDAKENAHSLNIFLLNSLVGVRVKHVLDLSMDNEPSAKGIPPWSQIATALRLRSDLERADKEYGTGKPQLAYRTVAHLAGLEFSQSAGRADKAISPYWLRLRAEQSIPRIDAKDFRDELNVGNYPNNELIWNIEAASNRYDYDEGSAGTQKKIKDKKAARWQFLGQLRLTASVVSAVCDKELHFSHPVTH